MTDNSDNSTCMKAIAYIKKDIQGGRDYLFKLGMKNEPVVTDLGNGLLVTYLVEKTGKFEYVQNWNLKEEKITNERILEIGLLNLKKLATRSFKIRPIKNIFVVILDGNFEASLILINELWEKILKTYIKHTYIAAIPTRDMLIFCDSMSEEGIKEIKAICKRVKSEGERLLSESLYIRNENKWTEFLN